ncbi:hypothetical protein WR25_14511 [Diploscapter pachys]|uniref:Uncharacterized protein n=1 Tax=Diploscapter pachys TaxID=2018661 RepID=A0A2A2M352_9BILA|nr:hypothetical protein WR25_14511 [Diploscapter pachys]
MKMNRTAAIHTNTNRWMDNIGESEKRSINKDRCRQIERRRTGRQGFSQYKKEQSRETSEIDMPEGDLLGLRLEMGCLEEEIEKELEMEMDRNADSADRDKQVDEQGCRAVRSFR